MQNMIEHYQRLEQLYLSSPINDLFPPTIKISDGHATLTTEIGEQHFHPANAAHGTNYFKALDDACFYAVASKITDMFVLTTAFNMNLTKPLGVGPIRAEGRWVHGARRVFLAEGILYDAEGDEVARASGTFMRSRKPLESLPAYRDAVIDTR